MFAEDNSKNLYRFDYIIDAKVDGGYFSYYEILSRQSKGTGQLINPKLAGYILLNEKMEAVDTAKSNTKRRNLYYHDFRINEKGERLVNLRKDTYLDMRDYTDNQDDSAIHCNIDYIQIIDKDDKILFSWNPLEHVPADLFRYKSILSQRAFGAKNSDLIEWTRLTSAVWDYDGNILYSMKNIGIGKISRVDGHIIWHVDYTDIPLTEKTGNMEWYNQHDFNFLYDNDSVATYSLFSNGDADMNKIACGVVFEIMKKDTKFKLVKYVYPKRKYFSNGQGNLDYSKNGNYVIAYGSFDEPDSVTTEFWSAFEYGKNDSTYAVFLFPRWNQCYKAHRLENWPKPPRPVIIKNGGVLEVSGPKEMKNFTWYQLSGDDNTNITKVADGNSIKPQKGAKYCVEGQYGVGFSVSRVYWNK